MYISTALSVLEMVTEKLKWVMNQVSKKKGGLVAPLKTLKRMTLDSVGEDLLEEEYDTSK